MFPGIPGTVRALPKRSSQHESSRIHHHCSSNLNLTLKKEVPLNLSLQNVSYCHKSFNPFTATFLRARKCWKIQENVLIGFVSKKMNSLLPTRAFTWLVPPFGFVWQFTICLGFVKFAFGSERVKQTFGHDRQTDRQTKSTKPGLPAGSAMFYCNIWQDKCTVYATHSFFL